ncbi:MAG TPA: alpha-hydroxy acid oxidase [Nocardioides sp.]|uniref:alpha-hydroxy acid oxidase n=1 Tax=Nocardioides sp. TaxID=35761 RepID=UPI002E329F8C|nr:alpha-hydroxy acid oxidase [Nocardioides sp.]HEX3929863.1 alpha-hydroxy acid oxidase [Nocardioides sp.]
MELEPVLSTSGRLLDHLPELARRAIRPAVWAYVEAGAGGRLTVSEAEAAWRSVRFRTRVLRGGGDADLRTTLLGTEVSTPIAIAPTAMQRAVHPTGERGMAEGAGPDALHVVSSNCGTRFDDLRAPGPWWLQAYLPPDRELFRPVVEDAVTAGARAIVLTVDTPHPGTKRGVDEEDWSSVDLSWWRVNYPRADVGDWKTDLDLDDIGWLREAAGVPVVVKGVLRGDDAARCLDAGADAIFVSNHGGRQLDRAASTASALREVAAAVGDRTEVYVDGGIRSGADVLAALALGARGVLVGRPALWALGVDGGRGVGRLLAELTEELRECLELAGCACPDDAPDLL